MWHKITHLFGWNKGMVEAWYDTAGNLWIGFRCNCGKLCDAFIRENK